MRGGRLQPGSIMKWLAVGLAASPTKGWGRRRELGSLPMKVSSAQVQRRRVRFQICAQRAVAAGAEELAQRRLGDDEEDGEGGDRRQQAHSDG